MSTYIYTMYIIHTLYYIIYTSGLNKRLICAGIFSLLKKRCTTFWGFLLHVHSECQYTHTHIYISINRRRRRTSTTLSLYTTWKILGPVTGAYTHIYICIYNTYVMAKDVEGRLFTPPRFFCLFQRDKFYGIIYWPM